MIKIILYISAVLYVLSEGKTKEEWKRKTIYQIVTDRFWRTNGSTEPCQDLTKYCGGTFKGIQDKLGYIKDMGFDAIWISPILENFGNDYHGYAALDWYKVNPYFGNEQDLENMIRAAQSMGIWVMLDVVANHVAYIDTDYYKVTPFNESSHYHNKCQIVDWNDRNQVEYCRLANLPDLNQDNQWVRQTLLNWVRDIVGKFKFDGIRIDTVPHVKKEFWREYAQYAGVYQIGEVFNGDIEYVSYYTHEGLDATMNYPLYFTLKNVFNYKQSMLAIRSTLINETQSFSDIHALGVFIENHDNPRFLNLTENTILYKSALAFVVFSQGIPIIYYGSEQGFNGGKDPENREPLWTSLDPNNPLYKYLATLISVRKRFEVWSFPHVERLCDDSFYSFTRGHVLVALTNQDNLTVKREITNHPYRVGERLCNVLRAGDCINVSAENKLTVNIVNGEAKIYVPKIRVRWSETKI